MTTPVPRAIHQSLLSGLLGFIGSRDGEQNLAGPTAYIFRLSLFRATPLDRLSADERSTVRQLVARSTRNGSTAAPPGESQYSDVTFEARVRSWRLKVSLYNLPIVTNRRQLWGGRALEARALFIQQGLVEGQLRSVRRSIAQHQASCGIDALGRRYASATSACATTSSTRRSPAAASHLWAVGS